MRAHEPAMAADSPELNHDMVIEVRDYLEWLLRRKGLIPRPELSRRRPNPAKGGGDENS